MSWIPAFEIGLWNAWILALFLILYPYIMSLVDKLAGTGDINRKMGDAPVDERSKRLNQIPVLFLIVLFIYSIFIPLKLGTPWFYLGLAIYLVGVTMFVSSIVTVAKTPLGQIFTRGMYRYSRHPLYLSLSFVLIGISVAAASWLFLVLSMGWMAIPISQVRAEEQGCMDTFGNDYQEYLNRTPRWLGIPKSN